MKNQVFFTIIVGIFLVLRFTASAQQIEDFPIFKMEEFHGRDGLPNVFHKINNRRQVRIAYIGGSITEAREGWRDLTFSWFRLNFPYTAFFQTNATIGGTGSDLGVFRMERDVLVHKPDLLFVEFAVNDSGKERIALLKSMEGLVRKAWAADPEMDICFVYTTAEIFCDDLVNGKQQHAVTVMEEVADYYGIPSIHMGLEVARLYAQNKLVLSADPSENANTIVFTKDRTHPLPESGHPLYGHIATKYLEKMSHSTETNMHVLSTPYVQANWENASFVDASKAMLQGNWRKLTADDKVYKQFEHSLPALYRGKPGAVMEFTFKGTDLGFYDCVGPGTGVIEITVDGTSLERYRFDQWCDNYRKNSFMIGPLADGIHHVTVKVTGKPIDKGEILKKKNIKIDDPAKYKELDWYPADIMIVGELIQ